ncbi:MAG: LytTR family DNA-binding domain-containing protein [Gemmatimonadetes bacterium]|nr:LytTR family DNA-binding domain-containing protein [Gemmatimonadota bacterium]
MLIVDDERAARQRLSIMLAELDVEVVGQAENGLEALKLVRERKPDVILLDITMPEVDGFDVAQHLADPKPLIVFQTAFDEYALQAFDHEAIDYLVKPVTLKKLQRAIERARAHIKAAKTQDLTQDVLRQLRASLQPTPTASARLLVRDRGGHRLIPHQEIQAFHAERGTVRARTEGADYPTDYTLADLEDRLGAAFIRPNRAELVNVAQIDRIASNGDGSATITLRDGTTVHVTRRRAAEVRKILEG